MFEFWQNEIKHEMSELILKTDSKNLQQFSFQISNGKIVGDVKFENENEVIINGKWFDISSKKNENGKLILTVLSDEIETEIVNADKAETLNCSSIESNHNAKKSEKQKESISEFLIPQSLQFDFYFNKNIFASQISFANSSAIFSLHSPPPKA